MLINHCSTYLYTVCNSKQLMLIVHLKTYIGVSFLELLTDYGKRLKNVGRRIGIKLLIFGCYTNVINYLIGCFLDIAQRYDKV